MLVGGESVERRRCAFTLSIFLMFLTDAASGASVVTSSRFREPHHPSHAL